MTVDAVRAGLRLEEIEIDLEHRATARDARRLRCIAGASSPQFLRDVPVARRRPAR